MLKKVFSIFLTLLILLSLLTNCSRSSDAGIYTPAFSPEAPISTPTPLPFPTENGPIAPETPTPSEEISPAKTEGTLVTQEVFIALSSPVLKGRVMGSAGAEKAQSIINNLFIELDLQPFHKDYIHPVFRDPFRKIEPLSVKGDGYNVIGLLPGKKSKECLIISAHYDGSENGNGALDNASGVYGLLKTAERLADYSKNQLPDRDIIFAAFDGEESGLIGSGYLADQIKERYEKCIVINLDCIGIKKGDSYMVAGDAIKYKALVDSLYQQLELYNFTTVPFDSAYGSDHLPFEWQDIPAVTIGEKDVGDIVHSSNDTADKVDIIEIEHLSEAVYSYILEQTNALYEILFPW